MTGHHCHCASNKIVFKFDVEKELCDLLPAFINILKLFSPSKLLFKIVHFKENAKYTYY